LKGNNMRKVIEHAIFSAIPEDENTIELCTWHSVDQHDAIQGELSKYTEEKSIVSLYAERHTAQLTLSKAIAKALWEDLKHGTYEDILIDNLT